MTNYLLLSRLQIHNANAASSPYTVGFPAMTAWLGAVHALERKMRDSGYPDLRFLETAVFSHTFEAQLYKGPGDYQYSIIGTANPLKKSNKTGEYERPPFIEEARCHLTVSLLVKAQGIDGRNEDAVKEKVTALLWRMKLAGGDLEHIGKVETVYVDGESDADERQLLRKLMPSYALIERRDLMLQEREKESDALDDLMEMLAVEYVPQPREEDEKAYWNAGRHTDGWIVPIAVGFRDISGEIKASHQRELNVEHHFVEPVLTLGEFRMPCHFQRIDETMWKYHTEPEQGLYICRNQENFDNR